VGSSLFPLFGDRVASEPAARISSLLIKPASAVCNLDCAYCFYLDRDADPYKALPERRMTDGTLEHLIDSYLFYSYPHSSFAFQGGEPTLAGVDFFRKVVEFQQRYGRNGQTVSNALQTNGILLDERWCELFREYNWLIGVSLDGPETMHDRYRYNRGGQPTWKRVMEAVNLLRKQKVEFNILCVLSDANVGNAKALYRFFRSMGVENLQFIPLAEFDADGNALPYTITAEQYGRFLVELFDVWWPDRRRVRVRVFDNVAEALAGQTPGTCTMHESCDSYCVVEYNGDVFPCDFFVERDWRLGNIHTDSWTEIARRQRRHSFASKKAVPHAECSVCEYQSICHGGCPKFRAGRRGQFEDLDYFCGAYKMIFSHANGPLLADVQKLLGRRAPAVRV
jgi:uncharacterized protein